jgi:hypothetical protein
MLRVFQPQPAEEPAVKALIAALEADLKACAKYELRIKTDTIISESTFVIGGSTSVIFKVAFDLGTTLAPADRFVATSPGTYDTATVRCPGSGVSCTTVGTRIEEPAELVLTLGDVPIGKSDGALAPSEIKPLLAPAFARHDVRISGRGVNQVLPFEVNYAFWWCHYASEFEAGAKGAGNSPGLFRPRGWQAGTYPVLFTIRRPLASKACEGLRVQLGIELSFRHTPAGSYTPSP